MQKLSTSLNNLQCPIKAVPLVACLPTKLGKNSFTNPHSTHLHMQTESRFIHDPYSHSASLWHWKRLQFGSQLLFEFIRCLGIILGVSGLRHSQHPS
jgi:hypothetical protein